MIWTQYFREEFRDSPILSAVQIILVVGILVLMVFLSVQIGKASLQCREQCLEKGFQDGGLAGWQRPAILKELSTGANRCLCDSQMLVEKR